MLVDLFEIIWYSCANLALLLVVLIQARTNRVIQIMTKVISTTLINQINVMLHNDSKIKQAILLESYAKVNSSKIMMHRML